MGGLANVSANLYPYLEYLPRLAEENI